MTYMVDSARAEMDYRQERLAQDFAAANGVPRLPGWLRRHRGTAQPTAPVTRLPVELGGDHIPTEAAAEHARVA